MLVLTYSVAAKQNRDKYVTVLFRAQENVMAQIYLIIQLSNCSLYSHPVMSQLRAARNILINC